MKKEIMILGVHHLDSPNNGDLYSLEMNVKSEKRQTEITELIQCLKLFQPTKIALEIEKEQDELIQQEYINFINGKFELSTNEKHQIGFRLAQELKHPKLYCVNWNKRQSHVPVLLQWVSENPCSLWTELAPEVENQSIERKKYLATHTLKEFILWLNEKEQTNKDHQFYMKLALIEDGDTPIGVQWVVQYWYYRNMLIYKNLTQLFDSNEERVLLIIGSAHVHLLTQFFEEHGEYKVIDVVKFLSTKI